MASQVVCAVDAGASWTRVALAEVTGSEVTVLAAVSAGPGNANAVGQVMAESNLAGALLAAHHVAELDPQRTSAIALGGASPRVCVRAAAMVLPHLTPISVSDVDLLAAVSTSPTVGVVGGTGSMAVRFDSDGRTEAGGWGWFLGDEGGGVWLGRQAVRAALRPGPDTAALREAVMVVAGHTGPEELFTATLYDWVYSAGRPQAQVGLLAGAVTELAAAGDPAAIAVTDEAAAHLRRLADTLGRPGDRLVFGGSVAAALTRHLTDGDYDNTWSFIDVAADGIPGAIVLAANGRGNDALFRSATQQWVPHRSALNPPWRPVHPT
jgi:N-acetylglucosamine kinase-like BadF-type ATPase